MITATFYTEIISSCSTPLSHPNGYIIPYNDTMEGATITFSCQNSCTCQGGLLDQSSLELHTAVCTSDGDWEPNPADFCSSKGYFLAQCINCTGVNFFAESAVEMRSDQPVTVVVMTSVFAFLVCSVFIFIIGFVCGHCFSQKFRRPIQANNQPSTDTPAPIYEVVQIQEQERDLEMKENVA